MVTIYYTSFDGPLNDLLFNDFFQLLSADEQFKNAQYQHWQDRHRHLLSRLLLIHAAKSYSFIHTLTNEKFLVSKYLKELEEDLPKDNFFRLHKKYIINVDYIELLKKNKQQLTVVLKNEVSLPVAFRRCVALKKVIIGKN